VLKELDEPRPAQEGDQLKVKLDTLVDGESIDERDDEEEPKEQTMDLVKGRLVDELYEGLLGMNVGDSKEIVATMPEDHGNEQVRGKEVTFKVEVTAIQERMLPEWEELPTLEGFEGTLDELRAKTRGDLETAAKNAAERKTLDAYIEQLVEQTSYDIPDVMVHELAHEMLHDQERQFSRYGISLEQMLQFRGQTHEQAIEALVPDAERQTKVTLALREVVRQEGLNISQDELQDEVGRMLLDYDEGERESVAQILQSQLISSVANSVLDRKLRERLIAIATGTAPAPGEAATAEANGGAEAASKPAAEAASEAEEAAPETGAASEAEEAAPEPEEAAPEPETAAKPVE
jgi:trigger factor